MLIHTKKELGKVHSEKWIVPKQERGQVMMPAPTNKYKIINQVIRLDLLQNKKLPNGMKESQALLQNMPRNMPQIRPCSNIVHTCIRYK